MEETADVSLTLLRHETSRLLKQHATAESKLQKNQAVESLCDLFVALKMDARYPGSEMLQQDAAKIRRRLLTVVRDEKNALRRKRSQRPAQLSRFIDQTIAGAIQQYQESQSEASNRSSQNRSAETSESSSSVPGSTAAAGSDAAPNSGVQGNAALNLNGAAGSQGNSVGQSNSIGEGNRGGFAPGEAANAWALIELIQRTVEPDFWEPRGGPGSIGYFAMKRVLVVRATSDVHQQIQSLLSKLPR